MWSAGRCESLCVRDFSVSSPSAPSAQEQIRHPHERRFPLGVCMVCVWVWCVGVCVRPHLLYKLTNKGINVGLIINPSLSLSLSQALSCVNDLPDVSMCDFLDQMIDLFCFYNGSVRRSYQVQTLITYLITIVNYFSKSGNKPRPDQFNPAPFSLPCVSVLLLPAVAPHPGGTGCMLGSLSLPPAGRRY